MGTRQYPPPAEAFTLLLVGGSARDLGQLSGRRFSLLPLMGTLTGQGLPGILMIR